MSKVIAIIDSDTGSLVDVAGNSREGARYRKFAGRMMSSGKDPVVLDYGTEGIKRLEISYGGYDGDEIALKARSVKVTGDLTVGGSTVKEIAESASSDIVFGTIVGKNGISVSPEADPDDEDKTVLAISMSNDVESKFEMVENAIHDLNVDGFVKKEDLADVIRGVEFNESDSLEMVKSKLNVMIERISELIGEEQE